MDAHDKDTGTQTPKKPPEEEQAPGALHRLYDKIPLTYKQVNLLVVILVALIVLLIVYGIIKGNLS